MDPYVTYCWAKATKCPTTSTQNNNGSQSLASCDAWYRCDAASSYVIRWSCNGAAGVGSDGNDVQTLEPSTAVTGFVVTPQTKEQLSGTSVFTYCGNSSASIPINTKLCPPPIVCPGGVGTDLNDFKVAANNVIDVDIILATVLSIFALVICIVMVVVTVKYWMMRWRFRRQSTLTDHYRHKKDTILSTNDKNPSWYFWDGYNKPVKMKGKLGNGMPYTDFFVPPSQRHYGAMIYRQFGETKNTNGVRNITRPQTSSPKTPKVKRAGKLFGDRSVSTGSFIYQSNNFKRGFKGHQQRLSSTRNDNESFSRKISLRSWVRRNNRSNYKPNSFRRNNNGNLQNVSATQFLRKYGGDLYFTRNDNYNQYHSRPTQYFVQPPASNSSSDGDGKSQYKKSQVVSSIHIPSYENNNEVESNGYSENMVSPNPYHFKGRRLFLFDKNNRQEKPTSGNRDVTNGVQPKIPGSWESSSSTSSNPCTGPFVTNRHLCCPEANGAISEAASIASQNWRYTNVYSRRHSNDGHSVDVQINPHLTKTIDAPIHTIIKNTGSSSSSSHVSPSTPNSPDVVSSHNLSRPVSHITHLSSNTGDHNTDTQVVEDYVARINVPSYSNIDYHNKRYRPQQQHLEDRYNSNNPDINTFQGYAGFIASKYNILERVHIPEDYASTCCTDTSSSSGSNTSQALLGQELSYDCFRNEHLRQLSREGAKASTSTLDKAVGNFTSSTKSFRLIPYHY